MVSKAFGLAKLGNAFDDGALSNRNLVINGAMQVAQRGTSFTTNVYGLDRWLVKSNGTPPTVTQQSDVFSVGGKSLKMVTDASSAYAYFSQRIEDLSYFSGKTITVSFDYKSTNDFYVQFEYNYGSGGSANESSKHVNLVSSSASTARGVVTVTIDDLSSKTFGPSNTSHLSLLFNSEVANPTTIEITNVQLEVGDTATPFEHRSYGDELARCQRYFETVYVWQQGHPTAIGQYVANSTGTYKATKRALPTLTEQVVTGGSSNGVTFGTFRNFELGGFGVQGISTKTGEIYRDTLVTADAEL